MKIMTKQAHNYSGKFITLEGIEGVGKTTLMKYLAEYLHQHDVPVYITREPGGTPLADDIRHFLLSEHNETIEPETELLLIFAARSQHINRVILPALEAGKLVLCDRFTDTSYAYQGAGRGIDKAKIAALQHIVQGDLTPDLTILLDAPIDIGLERIKVRKKTDRFESETKNFFIKARAAYLDMAKAEPNRFRIVDATQSIEALQVQVKELIGPLVQQVIHGSMQ
jgi:dTMP kinase